MSRYQIYFHIIHEINTSQKISTKVEKTTKTCEIGTSTSKI